MQKNFQLYDEKQVKIGGLVFITPDEEAMQKAIEETNLADGWTMIEVENPEIIVDESEKASDLGSVEA